MPRRIEGAAKLKRPSYDHERESRSQNDQRIYASDHDAEINVGHEILRLELSLPTEHRASPRNYLSCMGQAEDGHSFRGNVQKYTYVSGSKTIRSN